MKDIVYDIPNVSQTTCRRTLVVLVALRSL